MSSTHIIIATFYLQRSGRILYIANICLCILIFNVCFPPWFRCQWSSPAQNSTNLYHKYFRNPAYRVQVVSGLLLSLPYPNYYQNASWMLHVNIPTGNSFKQVSKSAVVFRENEIVEEPQKCNRCNNYLPNISFCLKYK